MKDLIKNYLKTIETTNDKETYEKTVQRITESLETVYNSNTFDKQELIELLDMSYIKVVKQIERFGYLNLKGENTKEQIKTMNCFSKLLEMEYTLRGLR